MLSPVGQVVNLRPIGNRPSITPGRLPIGRRLTICPTLFLLMATFANAVIIDRIAVIVNTRAIKDSDIDRDIRLTDFLNGDPLNLNEAERKKAVQRLIDQQLIRREVTVGNYPTASPAEVDKFLENIKKERFGAGDAYGQALRNYSITNEELRNHLTWQLTVLRFIEERFRPAVIVSEEEIDNYARTHPGPRDQIRELLIGQKVNGEFDSWLNRGQKRASIEYREPGLK